MQLFRLLAILAAMNGHSAARTASAFLRHNHVPVNATCKAVTAGVTNCTAWEAIPQQDPSVHAWVYYYVKVRWPSDTVVKKSYNVAAYVIFTPNA